MPDKTQQIIKDRHETHGDYFEVFNFTQNLKQQIRLANRVLSHGTELSIHTEALDKIITKIARIVHGDPNEVDHWQDIAGYAQIIVNHLEGRDCE